MSERCEADEKSRLVAGKGRPVQVATVGDGVVQIMRSRLTSQSKESVMDTLGISASTWLKIKKGQPIRRSTVEQLMRRLGVANR